jgi:hypothetical protein
LKVSLPQKECCSTAEALAMPEEHMMSQRSKRELLEEIHPRYLKAKKSTKKIMLEALWEFE